MTTEEIIAALKERAQERAKEEGNPFWGNYIEAVAARLLEQGKARLVA